MRTDLQMILDLQKRVSKLEEEIKNSKKEKIEWALSQFRYIEKTPNQSEAFAIIEEALQK